MYNTYSSPVGSLSPTSALDFSIPSIPIVRIHKQNKRSKWIWILSIAVVLLLIVCSAMTFTIASCVGIVPEESVHSFTTKHRDYFDINLSLNRADVRFSMYSGTTLDVIIYHSGQNATISFDLDHSTLSISQPKLSSIFSFLRVCDSLTVQFLLPPKFSLNNLNISSEMGIIDLSGLSSIKMNSVSVSTSRGSIRSDSLRANSISFFQNTGSSHLGDIETGSLSSVSSSGDVMFGRTVAVNVSLVSTSGNQELTSLFAISSSFRTSRGTITIPRLNNGDVYFRSGSGRIFLGVGKEWNGPFDIHTTAGSVNFPENRLVFHQQSTYTARGVIFPSPEFEESPAWEIFARSSLGNCIVSVF
ncbi:hypothetical protein P9112_004471 [Eukaryota sp. TZLM1-RC]